MNTVAIRSLVERSLAAGLIHPPVPAPAPRKGRPPAGAGYTPLDTTPKTRQHRRPHGYNTRLILELASGGLPFTVHDIPELGRAPANMAVLKHVRAGHLRLTRDGHGTIPNEYTITPAGQAHLETLLADPQPSTLNPQPA